MGQSKKAHLFTKRPAPTGFVKRIRGPAKSMAQRKTQLDIETADETSLLIALFLVAHQNVKPNFEAMENLCVAMNKKGHHYAKTANAIEHLFRDWRIYADLLVDYIGGEQEAIKAGARPKSDRAVERLKKKNLLPKNFVFQMKTNKPKDDDSREDTEDESEPEIDSLDTESVTDSSPSLTCNAPQSNANEVHFTSAEPVQKSAARVPEEPAENVTTKPAEKKTQKRKRTKAGMKDQPEDRVVAHDSSIIESPANMKDNTSLRQINETSTSKGESQSSHALDHEDVDTGFDTSDTAALPTHVAEQARTSAADHDEQSTAELEKLPPTGVTAWGTPIHPLIPQYNHIGQKMLITAEQAAKDRFMKVQYDKMVAATPVFKHPERTFTEYIDRLMKQDPSDIPRLRTLFTEEVDPKTGKKIYEKKPEMFREYVHPLTGERWSRALDKEELKPDYQINAWIDVFNMVKIFCRDPPCDAELDLPDMLDIQMNMDMMIGADSTPSEYPHTFFRYGTEIIVAALSRKSAKKTIQSVEVLEATANEVLDKLKTEQLRLEAKKELKDLKNMRRNRDDVWNLEGRIKEMDTRVKTLKAQCAEEEKTRGNILEFCQEINDKYRPGGELYLKDAIPNPRFDRVFVRKNLPCLIPQYAEPKQTKGKGKRSTKKDQSVKKGDEETPDNEAEDDYGANAPAAKRRKTSASNAEAQSKPEQQRKPRGGSLNSASAIKEATHSESSVPETPATRAQQVRAAKSTTKLDMEIDLDVAEAENAAEVAASETSFGKGSNIVDLQDDDDNKEGEKEEEKVDEEGEEEEDYENWWEENEVEEPEDEGEYEEEVEDEEYYD
ncbi:MAG: hypothetical protein L6R41_003967 [Letrouitia leprolyta]|nr:MAG: hypothetical protein L6R41_003967 [Letrouitia leprolyta]